MTERLKYSRSTNIFLKIMMRRAIKKPYGKKREVGFKSSRTSKEKKKKGHVK